MGLNRAALLGAVGLAVAVAAPSAHADNGSNPSAHADNGPDGNDLIIDIDVVSKRLDEARQRIQPSLGASVYRFSPDALQAVPQGENAPLNQVLLQAPGVVQDSFGQIHVRGEHANLQYRINGVQLPDGLSMFGQAIESRFAQSMSLVTGALPAQYGFQTAGVVDIQTKTGLGNPGLAVSMYGGQSSWLQPSFEYGGHAGPVDWYITGDVMHNTRGIENPAPTRDAIHDTTNQWHGLAYVSGIVDPDTRISMILGSFEGQFQIPNNPGQQTLGFPVNGVSSFNSARLDENQWERNDFAILSLQKHVNDVDLQVSAYTRYSWLNFSPDWLGDLLFNGIAQQARRSNIAYGIQSDGSWRINDSHTLRAGFLVQQAIAGGKSYAQVLPTDSDGSPTTEVPIGVANSFSKTGGLYGMYVQDEWRVLPTVTINGGLRFDGVAEFTNETQVSPRLNVVWKPAPTTTLTAGYARYFVPPPFELVSPDVVQQFAGTTAAPAVTRNDPVRAERSNYFDVALNQVVIPGLTIGVDTYYKISNHLLDEGQFGAPVVLTAFNYAHGRQLGTQLSVNYERGPLSLYGNIAWARAIGTRIVSAQFNFDPDELAYIAGNYIYLDHNQTWTGSAGAAYALNHDTDHPTRFSVDALLQSGLRASTAAVPNGVALPAYGVVNLSVVQRLPTGTELRLDVLNVGDTVYQIRNGTGVGVGAPQYGLRRTVLAGLTQRF
ncbi:TonB-dependent receptor [Rhodopila sp.]|uniref:TonB-dependent receptor n=1 Tax=Rhodopila sp. TaxID=2480087 RepID=UPI002C7D967C|nr:TonB-dependent receptor [Rhodopila sp.]HVZ09858.1 TonB-dependent receptor [Rhodopila sp.]